LNEIQTIQTALFLLFISLSVFTVTLLTGNQQDWLEKYTRYKLLIKVCCLMFLVVESG